MGSIAALLATTALLGTAAVAPAAAAGAGNGPAASPLGNKSLAAVLTSDGNRFDKDWEDYDIVTEAVLAVIAAKPHSPVAVLTKGKVPLTAFVPNDWSFRQLATELSGTKPKSEKQVFTRLAALGTDAIESVLLYHVMPGATIDSKAALRADGVALKTAQGCSVTVDVIWAALGTVRRARRHRGPGGRQLARACVDRGGAPGGWPDGSPPHRAAAPRYATP